MSIPIQRRLADIAGESPDRTAVVGFDVTTAEQTLTWRELADSSARLADSLRTETSRRPGVVAVPAANTLDSIVRIVAVLCAGLPLLPVNPAAKPHERQRLFDFVARHHGAVFMLDDNGMRVERDAESSIGRSSIAYLLPTGGSSGVPKLAIRPGPLHYDPRHVPSPLRRQAGWRPRQRQLILGPLHHAAPFMTLLDALLDDNTVIVPPYFLPAWAVRLVEHYSAQWIQLTPAHMRSIALQAEPEPAAFTSVRTVLHTAAPCDSLTKRTWLDLVGPKHLYEMYGSTEGIGATLVRGDEWLRKPGTVGRGLFTQVRILGEDGTRLGPGEVGKVFMRAPQASARNTYLGGALLETTMDGFASVGDYGRLDEEGYLFLAPRRHDMINVGGENVYPNEIESQLLEHPGVLDAMAAAVPHDTLGSTVGAFVVRAPKSTTTTGELVAHCRGRLANYKVPTHVEFVDRIPRTAAGKIQRWRTTETA